MAEEELNVVDEIQQEEAVPPQQEEAQAAPETTDKEYNFKQLRESKRQLEEEMKALRDELESIKSPPSQEEELGDDELVEGRHVKKLYNKITQYIQQKEAETIPDRLRAKFDDFDSVVTRENVEKLQKLEPELYRTIVAGTDVYAKGVAAYKTLRSLGIGTPDNYSQAKEEVQKKRAQPTTSQAMGSPALHEAGMFANSFTPDLKKQLLNEMIQSTKAL